MTKLLKVAAVAVVALAGLCLGTQAHAQALSPAARISGIETQYDVTRDGRKGMLVRMRVEVDGLQGQEVRFASYFSFGDGVMLRALPGRFRAPNGQVTVQATDIVRFPAATFPSVELFMPYDELNMAPGVHQLKYVVEVTTPAPGAPRLLAVSRDQSFTFTQP